MEHRGAEEEEGGKRERERISRLFRAGTKESRMTNAKRARGQPDLRAKSVAWGIKEDVGSPGSPPLYKELPVKNNTRPTPASDRPDSANYSFLHDRSGSRSGAASYSGTYLTVNEVGRSTPSIQPSGALDCR